MGLFDSNGGEVFAPASYVHQFEEILEYVDTQIFGSQHLTLLTLSMPGFFPGHGIPGYHIQEMITYRATEVPPVMRNHISRPFFELYLIWEKEIALQAEKKIVRNGALGEHFSDADFRRMLIACALTAVRYRVLQHRELFPTAALRTLKSAYSDPTIPEAHRRMLFQKKSEIPKEVLAQPYRLDGYLLLIFANMAMADNRPMEDAFHYLTNT